jgi:hypothetical protein
LRMTETLPICHRHPVGARVTPLFLKGIKNLEKHLCINNYICCIHTVAYFIV